MLWEGILELPPGLPLGEPMENTFNIFEDGTIHCSFLHKASGNKKEVDLAPEYKLDDKKKSDIDDFLLE